MTKSWLRRRAEQAIVQGLQQAYQRVKVDPERYLLQLRIAHGLPVTTYSGMFNVPLERLDEIAEGTIRAGVKMAVAEGAGFGLGGFLTLIPDLSILAAITLRTIQKLSLIYGFEYNTDEETAELWMAAASAAGVDISRELLEKQVVRRFIPRVMQRIAAQASREVAEKWAGRLVPLVSSAIGGTLNYWFVRTWSERALFHFREKHLRLRQKALLEGEK